MASPQSIDDSTGKGVLQKADPIADTFREEVRAALAANTRPPKLVGILSTSSAPSKFYATFTKKQCEDMGVEFVLKLTGAAVSSEFGEGDGVEEAIIEANEDDSVDGIMVRNFFYFIQRILKTVTVGILPDIWSATGL